MKKSEYYSKIVSLYPFLLRILQNPNADLFDAAITHNGVLDLKNGVIDKMRMSITCDEVEKLMIKAQRKEWK